MKCPLTKDGLKAVKYLSGKGIRVNQTLCFSAPQALLSAKAGATYISPFLGRLDDIAHVGMDLVRDICEIYRNYGFKTQVLAASIRNPLHVVDAAKAGAHVATMPFAVLESLMKHPLTDIGLKKFLDPLSQAALPTFMAGMETTIRAASPTDPAIKVDGTPLTMLALWIAGFVTLLLLSIKLIGRQQRLAVH